MTNSLKPLPRLAVNDKDRLLQGDIKIDTGPAFERSDDRARAVHVQIHARDRLTGSSRVIALEMVLGKTGKTRISLTCATPEVGDYDLDVAAFPYEKRAAVALHHGPGLRIIP